MIASMGDNSAIISKVYVYAGYTYGPLLGLYAYGLFTSWKAKDVLIPIIAILSPFITYYLVNYLKEFQHYDVGFLVLPINGIITFVGLGLSNFLSLPKKKLDN